LILTAESSRESSADPDGGQLGLGLHLHPIMHTIMPMPGARLYWTLVFTDDSLEHLGEREIDAGDVADAVFGRHGPARVRHGGRGSSERWFVVAPLSSGELLTCVLRAAEPRDLEAAGVFVIPRTGLPEDAESFSESMRFCVSARVSDHDEAHSYRAWRRSKGGRR